MEKKFVQIMIKKELKDKMDELIKEIGFELSYSALITHLIEIKQKTKKQS